MNSDDNFFDIDKPIGEITLQELDRLGARIFDQRKKCEEMEGKLKVEHTILERMQAKMLSILEQFGRTNHSVPGLGKLVVAERSYVTLPKTPEEKDAFYTYLKDRGIFEELISVNSNTLNAFYKREREVAIEEGRASEFKIPGIGEPSTAMQLRMMKGR